MKRHLRHHSRFYGSTVLGLLVWAGMAEQGRSLASVVAGDAFFVGYLISTAIQMFRATPEELRRRATYDDEGIPLIFVITAGAIGLSLASIFALIRGGEYHGTIQMVCTIASVPLGRFTLHTLLAFRYAHIFYAPAARDGDSEEEQPEEDAGGLDFPSTDEPGAWEFLYFSFVVGMTAQTSDVDVMTTQLRRLTVLHSIVSFFYNTVIVALTVNIAAR
jgi:uncharacterized membrane protein